jgi:hypothetical protein
MEKHQRSIAIGKTTLQRGAKIENATQVGCLSARMGGLSIWKMNKNHCKDNYFYTKSKFFEKKFEKHLTSKK